MNRYLSPGPDGTVGFRHGRIYRMLLVVNGPCDVEDVEELLTRNGFVAPVSSTPDTWDEEKPDDWPAEGALRLSVNECPLRVSGIYEGDAELHIRQDTPIGRTGATVTVAQAWDYGEAPSTSTGQASAPATSQRSPLPIVGAAIASMVGIGIWQHYSAQKRMEKARAQMLSAETKAEQLSVTERMQALISRGYSEEEAAAFVEHEDHPGHEPQVIYVMP